MFKYNSAGIDPDGSILLIPDGWYTMKIRETEELMSSNGNPQVLAKCGVVNNPEYADAEIWSYITFLPKENKGAGIAIKFLKVIGEPWEGEFEVDCDSWVGKKFMGHIIRETYKEKTRNKIDSVKSLDDGNSTTAKKSSSEDDVPF